MTMTAEPQWNSTRWRDASEPPRYESLQHHPQLAALQTPQSGSKDSAAQPWYGTSHDQAQLYSYDSRRPSQAYGGQLSQYAQSERPAPSGNYAAPTQASYHHSGSYTGSWRSEPSSGHGVNDKRSGDTPLSLQIPNSASELPSISHGYTTPRSDAPMYSSGTSSWSQQTTSLPSFAALSEQTNRVDEPDEVEIAPMSARLPCTQCAKLVPLIRDIATAVAELDGTVQSLCNANESRSPDIPSESAMRTVQWILDRMRYTKRDMQDVARSGAVDQDRQQYANPLKRSAEQWDQDDMPTLKLPRPNASQYDAASGERRGSIDFAARDPVQRLAYSPAPSDSAPGSAYPRQGSPISGKLPRALPSPSSLAFPPSGPASFVPANAGSIGSPGTSYHPASSIHTVSTSSATSAHLQDLQHQVSLKSLALQTLQTEYATLLQKLQRERIKSQTIEKKTTVADQEVNDLTTRNEEMTEQIKTLETQLQESERKRECERADTAKEKEQWGRMLDMSGRLQNKSASDYQRVAKEKSELLQRLAAYETNGPSSMDLSQQTSRSSPPSTGHVSSGLHVTTTPSNDVEVLRRENGALQAKLEAMRSALQDLCREYGALEESIEQVNVRKEMLRKSMNEVAGDSTTDSRGHRPQSVACENPASSKPPHMQPEQQHPGALSAPHAPNAATQKQQAALPSPAVKTSGGANRDDPFSRENLAHIARAVSPGPAELGFHVQTSTSSPEELIRALGPVPAPLPSIRYPTPHDDWATSDAGNPKQGRRQSQPFVAPLSLPHTTDHMLPSVSSFRPLNQPYQTGQYSGASPHSHHSSPGPNLSNTSSPGSTSTRSPEYRIGGGRDDYKFARRHSQPQLATSPSTAAMPPPPRPMP